MARMKKSKKIAPKYSDSLKNSKRPKNAGQNEVAGEIPEGERWYTMSRNDIAKEIATELLNDGALDENNFGDDADALVEHVQSVILEHFKDYALLSGTVF